MIRNAVRRLVAGSLLLLAACTPEIQSVGAPRETARIDLAHFVTADGVRLPLRRWQLEAKPRFAVIALHGFNDYSSAFEGPGRRWAEAGGAVYAYDQRGFGATPHRGVWAGDERLIGDLVDAVRVVRERHPDRALYVVGESMGGAVAMATFAAPDAPKIDGLVLVAPAVWARSTMNPFYRALLWTGAHVAPTAIVTGRGLRRQASDNIPMLIALGRDPLVIKETRIDALWGLVGLMDRALDAAPRLSLPTLVLYGERDEIVPPHATKTMLEGLATPHRMAVYGTGWHMLLRDLKAEIPQTDILAWIENPKNALPSGAETDAMTRLEKGFARRVPAGPVTAGSSAKVGQ